MLRYFHILLHLEIKRHSNVHTNILSGQCSTDRNALGNSIYHYVQTIRTHIELTTQYTCHISTSYIV